MEIESPDSNRTKRGNENFAETSGNKSPKNTEFGPSTVSNTTIRLAQESATIINDKIITDILDGTTTVPNEPKTLLGFLAIFFHPILRTTMEMILMMICLMLL